MKLENKTDNTASVVVTRFWVSWIQSTEDYRPLSYPPHASILGWWCSGYDGSDHPILVALIEAKDEKEAEEVVRKEWPEWNGWRFIESQNHDYLPSDRFPLSDWMKARIL